MNFLSSIKSYFSTAAAAASNVDLLTQVDRKPAEEVKGFFSGWGSLKISFWSSNEREINNGKKSEAKQGIVERFWIWLTSDDVIEANMLRDSEVAPNRPSLNTAARTIGEKFVR